MSLIALILLPLLGGVAALFAARLGNNAERWLSVGVLGIGLVVLVAACFGGSPDPRWLAFSRTPWAPSLGVQLLFAVDGLSAAMLALSLGLGMVAVFTSWQTSENSGLFHAALLWTVAASNGVFMSFDLLVLAFFWELMVVPSFLLIALWGHGAREASAMKFLIFNAVAGLGLLGAVFWLGASAPVVTFDAFELAKLARPAGVQTWLLAGFALAFVVKLAVPPFHAWLPDAHTDAPTAGSILLAGLLLKTGAYGLFRFPAMLFPEGYLALAPVGLVLGSVGALYGAVMACGQTDAKRLVAYTSVAHMSIVLMGVSGGVHFALMGAAVEMVGHAFSASLLFFLIGAVYDRVGTRDLRDLGGLQRTAPRFAAVFALGFSAVLAMPGTANFLGEALVITGMFQVNWIYAAIVLTALVVSVVYATRLLKEVVFGEPGPKAVTQDLGSRELSIAVVLGSATLLFGLLPQLLMTPFTPAVDAVLASLEAVRR